MYDLSAEYAALARDDRLDWDLLDGSSVLVTGATGLVGSLCVRLLLERNRLGADISVYALVRNIEKARAVLAGYTEADGLHYVVQDVCDFSFAVPCAYVIHAACPTASAFFAAHPVETADAVVRGTRSVLAYARDVRAASMVYISSMEMYGDGNPEPGTELLLSEGMPGVLDPMRVRSCYPEGKRMAENYCAAFASEYGLGVKVARLAQTFGPGIPKADTRLFAQVARAAMAGEDIVLKTTGASTRMYVYTLDAVVAIFTLLTRGEAGAAYNVANPSTYSSVRGMAEEVMETFSGGSGHVIVDVDPGAPYPPEHHLPLDVSRLRALDWKPEVGLLEMYRRLIAYLRP